MRWPFAVAVALAALMTWPAGAAAQAPEGDQPRVTFSDPKTLSVFVEQSVTQQTMEVRSKSLKANATGAQSPSSRERSVTKRIIGGAVGATAGFFAGGYLGAWIDGDCGGCDDPGLKGALIGAPIGAAVGGILGALFLF